MEKIGLLNFNNNVPEVDGMQIAFYPATDPFQMAKTILNAVGVTEGEGVSVRGTPKNIAGQQVLLMSWVSKVSFSAASWHLPGSPVTDPATVTCMECQYVNTGVISIDLNDPDDCQNPSGPPHPLKLI